MTADLENFLQADECPGHERGVHEDGTVRPVTTFAVTVCMRTSRVVNDDVLDRLVYALVPHSGAIAHTEDVRPTQLDIVLDVDAADPGSAAAVGLQTALDVLAAAGCPSVGSSFVQRNVPAESDLCDE